MDDKEKLSIIKSTLTTIRSDIQKCKDYVSWEGFIQERSRLQQKTEDQDLWENPDMAKECLREFTRVDSIYQAIQELERSALEGQELVGMLEESIDGEMLAEVYRDVNECAKNAHTLVYRIMLSAPEDSGGCYLLIQSGVGGTDAQDWAYMLLQMYMRWCGAQGHTAIIDDSMDGEEAGIKHAVLRVGGKFAYGFLKTETGIHRLVRQSPFNAASKRQTSFASVLVMPIVEEGITVEILEKDLRIDTYRASGAGGQHVNKTDSAVRITHLPTGISVQCQSDRSQHRNKDQAMKMLHARLYAQKEQEKKEQEQSVEKTSIGWGHQIRSYVLHPYRLVKDLRTKVEVQNPEAVLQGEIDVFLEAALVHKGGETND